MPAEHNYHSIGKQVVHDRREGPTVERSHFSVDAAKKLRDELDKAIAEAEAS